MDTFDSDIYSLVSKYGFSRLHSRLLQIMRIEYDYMRQQFEEVKDSVIDKVEKAELKTIQVSEPTIPEAVEPQVKKTRKPRTKKLKVTADTTEQIEVVRSEEVANLILPLDIVESTEKPSAFRDPKEMKEYQKKSEEERRKENEAAGIQLSDILTKENLKLWIEDEGRTYAWVAREKAGCADTQVAATAQMMGIKSKISMKRRKIMSGR